MEKWATKESKQGTNQVKQVKIPIIKVLQWGYLRAQDNSFCVPSYPFRLEEG
jgi:hypothetical protein